jgi:Holliday junction resolvase RusA-like endonuclease
VTLRVRNEAELKQLQLGGDLFPSSALPQQVDGESIVIVVYGSPGPQGSKKFVGVNKYGRGIMVESSKKVKPWREDVKAAAEAARKGAPPIDAPVVLRMVFTLPKPASAPKRRRTWAMRKPDLSKLARSTEDALTDAGLLADDARIVEYERLAKVFPNEDAEALEAPGVRIEIKFAELL